MRVRTLVVLVTMVAASSTVAVGSAAAVGRGSPATVCHRPPATAAAPLSAVGAYQGSSWRIANTTFAGRSASRRMYQRYHASPYAISTCTRNPAFARRR